jgi:FMN-dependent NADH-azoreductase
MTTLTDQSSNLLLVAASPRGAESESLTIAGEFVEAYRAAAPHAAVDQLNVFESLPTFGARHAAAKMAAITGRPIPVPAIDDWEEVQVLGSRVSRADTLLFAVPMWNGGLPWALKLFIDLVTQPGIAFRFHPDRGYEGLLSGRRAVTVYASRVFAPGVAPQFGVDHQSTYLRWWLEFCGITEIHELRLQPTYPTTDLDRRREAALHEARKLASELASTAWRR